VRAATVVAARAQQAQTAGATDWFGRGIVAVRQEGTEVQLDLRVEAQGMLLRLAEGQPIHIVAVGPFAAGESVVRLPPEPPERVTVAWGQPVRQSDEDQAERQRTIDRATCMQSQAAVQRQATRQGPASSPPADPNTPQPAPTSPYGSGANTGDIAGICVSTSRLAGPRTTSVLRAPPREYLLLILTDHAIDSTVTRRIAAIPGFDPSTAAHDLSEYLVGRHSPMWAGYFARR